MSTCSKDLNQKDRTDRSYWCVSEERWVGKWVEGFSGSGLQSAFQFYHFSATVISSGRWSLSHELNNYSLMYISSFFLLTLFKFELKLDSLWEYCHWKIVLWSFYLSDCEGAFWKSMYCRNWILNNGIPSREFDIKAEGDFSSSKFFMLNANNKLLKHSWKGNRCDEMFVKVVWPG